MAPSVAQMVEDVLGTDLPVAIEAFDGSRTGPADAPAALVLKSPAAFQRILTAPGELGFGRAYVAGDLDVRGSIWDVLALRDRGSPCCASPAPPG
jgi:cyclopropane-fatty-acyl-phospholipid synthase